MYSDFARTKDSSNGPASYIEGVVRGYRNALLTSQNYSNLTQCETIDGKLCPNGAHLACT
jgi:hypothetical protein